MLSANASPKTIIAWQQPLSPRLNKIKNPTFTNDVIFNVCPDDLLAFAQTLIGTPYQYATSNAVYGFDCSGFVNYVFKKFNINVPRSSSDFMNIGERVKIEDAKPGDIILFTGTHTKSRRVGHVGIIMCNECKELQFIHSTSGKEHGVTITALNNYYRHRFVQIIRLFKQNNEI